MSENDGTELSDATRRTILRGAAGALGVGAMGGASAHEWDSTSTTQSGDNRKSDEVGGTSGEKVRNAGYHSLGGRGPESGANGQANNPHEGAVTELRTHGDFAYVGMFSSRGDSEGRGMAVVDISAYNNAETEAEIDNAEMSVVSFFRNTNAATAYMDLKLSGDGNFVFVGTQPITALFNETPTGPGYDPNDSSTSGTNSGGVIAIDVSDPYNPRLADAADYFSTGIHNLFHHRINGTDYVFACKDIDNSGDAGVNVFRFDRTTGTLTQVNRWTVTSDGEGHNNAQGDITPTGGLEFYCHDVEVQDDPITGRPTVYVAYWNAGVRVLDASDPTNLEQIGHFPMRQAHFTTPAPDLIDGKRVLVASHEEPGNNRDGSGDGEPADEKRNPYSTGSVFITDASGIYEHVAEDGTKIEGKDASVTEIELLDDWTWQDAADDPNKDDIEFDNFELSPHNSDVAKHVDPRTGEESFWVHQAHYHGGLRYLRIIPGNSESQQGQDNSNENGSAGWKLEERGWTRPAKGVPKESTMEGLSDVTPNIWGAVESNGVTFAADINQGVHAVRHEDIPIGGADPIAGVERSGDSPVFRPGGTNGIELDVTFADSDILLRDRLPDGWAVAGEGDGTEVADGGETYVEFDGDEAVGSLRYFAEAPDEGGSGTFGPVQASADGGDSWVTLSDTSRTVYVVGQPNGLVLGTAAGAVGALAHQRDRVRDRLADLTGRSD
jgi:hypothetical protein